jgi:hypothetical protein
MLPVDPFCSCATPHRLNQERRNNGMQRTALRAAAHAERDSVGASQAGGRCIVCECWLYVLQLFSEVVNASGGRTQDAGHAIVVAILFIIPIEPVFQKLFACVGCEPQM